MNTKAQAMRSLAEQAFEQGQAARLDATAFLLNPWPRGTAARQAWFDGWLHEDSELRCRPWNAQEVYRFDPR
jgi:hypothetical protein